MIGNQKQLEEGNTGTVSVKLHKWAIQLLDIIAESREHGTNANDLLKKCIEFIIETAKITGPVPPEMKTLIDMLKLDAAWHSAFNFGDVTATNDIAQVILILQQHDDEGNPMKGFGMVMIDKPYMPDAEPTMTTCVDDILERVTELGTPGNFRDLKKLEKHLGAESIRETLTIMSDAQLIDKLNEMDHDELPDLGNFTDFGRAIEYGKKTTGKQRYKCER